MVFKEVNQATQLLVGHFDSPATIQTFRSEGHVVVMIPFSVLLLFLLLLA